MSTLLGILGLILNMRNNDNNNSYEQKAAAFRDYWLDPETSYIRSDSKEGQLFDFRV